MMASNKVAKKREMRSPTGESLKELSLHQGPLPQIEDLIKYDEIIPNGADRFMKMAEEERKDRNALLMKELELREMALVNKHKASKNSLIISLIIIVLFLGICGYGFYLGYPKESAAILIASLVSIIGFTTYQKRIIEKGK